VSRLRRVPYTKPIPPGAKILTHKGKPHAQFKDERGHTVTAPLTEKGDRILLRSKKLYGEYRDAGGVLRCEPLSTDRTAAEQMLAARVKKAELKKAHISDPFEEHRGRPLDGHVADFEADLRAGGATAKHVRQTVACVRRVLDGCGFVLPASRVQQYLAGLRERGKATSALDPAKESYKKKELAALLGVKPSAVPPLLRRHRLAATGNGKARRYPRATAEALHSLRARGRSIKTSNLYLDAVKQFAAWLVEDRRLPDNPLAHLEGGNVQLDRRHDRRTLAPDELRRVIEAARQSGRSFRGLSGPDRAVLYCVACVSGFRASELAAIRPGAFDLDAVPPTVTLGAVDSKNGRTAVQPLPPDVASLLAGYLAGRLAESPVWAGNWFDNAADMLRIDLDAAGVPYVVDGPDGPLYADFHALRHSYIAMLDQSGATLKEAMQLARHSDPKLTMAVYGRARLHDLGEAVRRLPSVVYGPQAAAAQRPAATGTDGELSTKEVVSFRSACATGDSSCRLVSAVDAAPTGPATFGLDEQPLAVQGIDSDCEPVIASEGSSPTRTRTWNKPVNRRAPNTGRKARKPLVFRQFTQLQLALQA
jgi:integrase